VEVTKPGFSTYVQTGIVLQVASTPTLNVSLKVGAVSESIQVEANTTQVETQSTGIGGVIENKRILELPLNGRNAVELLKERDGRHAGRTQLLRGGRPALGDRVRSGRDGV
jgi:hypothetical protein